MSREKSGLGKFVLGAAVGAGLGLLFAPKKGSETRTDLKKRISDMFNELQNVDLNEVREDFEVKLERLQKEISDLDKEKVLKIAKKKSEEIKEQAEDLVNLAIEKGTPVLEDAAEDVRQKAIEVTKEVLNKLENNKN